MTKAKRWIVVSGALGAGMGDGGVSGIVRLSTTGSSRTVIRRLLPPQRTSASTYLDPVCRSALAGWAGTIPLSGEKPATGTRHGVIPPHPERSSPPPPPPPPPAPPPGLFS